MERVLIDFKKVDRGYEVAINEGTSEFYATRDEAWSVIYDSVRDVDFSTVQVMMNGLQVPAMDRLVAVVKSLF
jgi:hypothetical protein